MSRTGLRAFFTGKCKKLKKGAFARTDADYLGKSKLEETFKGRGRVSTIYMKPGRFI